MTGRDDEADRDDFCNYTSIDRIFMQDLITLSTTDYWKQFGTNRM